MRDRVDILCIAAHPDDAELHCGGTLLATAAQGGTFAICDVTAGERGTRGSAETRRRETEEACRRMGLEGSRRVNLGIPDGSIRITEENITRLVTTIRHFAPDILMIPSAEDRHPDHGNTHRLAREAWFNAGLPAVTTTLDDIEQKPHRPGTLLYYDHAWEGEPDVIVDISPYFDRKLDALAAYGTQFHVPGRDDTGDSIEGPATFISGPEFMTYMVARMRRYGFMIGTEYGEAFHHPTSPVPLNDIRLVRRIEN